MLEKRMAEIAERKEEIKALLRSEEGLSSEQIAEIEAEIDTLDAEVAEIEEKRSVTEKLNQKLETRTIEKPQDTKENVKMVENRSVEEVVASVEYRNAYYKALSGIKMTEAEERALTSASGSAGAAVPTTTLNQVIEKLQQTSALYNYISVSNIAEGVKLVVANAKNAASWKAEGSDASITDDTVTEVVLGGHELIKAAQISAKLYAMSIDALEAYVVGEIAKQIAIAIETSILNGTGTNQATGILTGVTWVDGTNANPYTTAVSYDEIVDTIALLPTMYHANAKFVMSRQLFWAIRKIKSTNGEPIFVYNPQDGIAGTIFGYPVVVSDYVGDNTTILFGDLSYYKFNIAQQLELSSSKDAAFLSGKITYRGLMVADGKPALGEAFVKAYLA